MNCKENCGYDFWAVGLNCCGTDDQVDFRCGVKVNAHGEVQPHHLPKGLRYIDNHDKPFFRLAVAEAEGVHGIKSKHPLFFEYLEKQTPDARVVEFARAGYINLLASVFAVFFVNFASMIVLAKAIPELSLSQEELLMAEMEGEGYR